MSKILVWIIAFPVAFVAIVILSLFEFFVNVFDLPTDLWKLINGDDSVLEK